MSSMVMRFVFLACALLLIAEASAFPCKGKNKMDAEVRASDHVFVGRIISFDTLTVVDSNQIKFPPDPRLIHELPPEHILIAHFRVEVLKTYKGNTTADTISVYSSINHQMYGLRIFKGREYIIYGNAKTIIPNEPSADYQIPEGIDKVWVTPCSRTTLKNKNELAGLEQTF